jgi:hypothetical protein
VQCAGPNALPGVTELMRQPKEETRKNAEAERLKAETEVRFDLEESVPIACNDCSASLYAA